MADRLDLAHYRREAGDGPEFMCRAAVNGFPVMMWYGATPEAAEASARAWFARTYDTPERRARLAELAERRTKAKQHKKEPNHA